MALNIDVFEFLNDSESREVSSTIKQKSSTSPIESESSSGISSLDSEELKKQLLSSPSISQEDEEPQSEENTSADDKPQEHDEDSEEGDLRKDEEVAEVEDQQQLFLDKTMVEQPLIVMYQERNIIELFDNINGAGGQFSNFAVLPENNVNSFFQNRAQYWRLSNADEQTDHEPLKKCPCCDFSHPISTQPSNIQGPAVSENPLTDSLMTFLKANEQMTVTQNNSAMNQFSSNNNYGYPMQQLSPQQRYPAANNATTLALLHMMNNVSKNAFPSWNNNSRGYGMFGKQGF